MGRPIGTYDGAPIYNGTMASYEEARAAAAKRGATVVLGLQRDFSLATGAIYYRARWIAVSDAGCWHVRSWGSTGEIRLIKTSGDILPP